MAKGKSRPQRWADAASRAADAINELVELQQEYSDWSDNLPDNLRNSALGQKLDEVMNLDLDGAQSTINEADGMDLPMGFGKD